MQVSWVRVWNCDFDSILQILAQLLNSAATGFAGNDSCQIISTNAATAVLIVVVKTFHLAEEPNLCGIVG